MCMRQLNRKRTLFSRTCLSVFICPSFFFRGILYNSPTAGALLVCAGHNFAAVTIRRLPLRCLLLTVVQSLGESVSVALVNLRRSSEGLQSACNFLSIHVLQVCCPVQKPDWSSCLPQASTVLAPPHVFVPCQCCWLAGRRPLHPIVGSTSHVLTSWRMYARSIAAWLSLWIFSFKLASLAGAHEAGGSWALRAGATKNEPLARICRLPVERGRAGIQQVWHCVVSCAGVLPDCLLSTSVLTAAWQ